MDLHPDFRDLLAEFARCGVSFAVIGGYAVGHHATPRATRDLDLLVSGEEANLARVADALHRFGAPAGVVLAARALAPEEIVYLGAPPVRIDIVRRADGIDTEDALARAEHFELDGLRIPVLAIDDLIANKRAAGRARDVADAELLQRVRARRPPPTLA